MASIWRSSSFAGVGEQQFAAQKRLDDPRAAGAGIAGADLTMIATVMNQVNWRKSAAEMARSIDMSLLDELQREGFFERLSK